MDRVFNPRTRPFDEIEGAAIAICSVAPDQRHIGVLHRQSGGVVLLDLAWHHRLRNQEVGQSERWLWVDPAIDLRRLRQVAAICRMIWRANPSGLPYSFSPPNACFDESTGRFLFGPTRLGLTCASFVLAVFHVAGLQLVHYQDWPQRSDGVEWQQQIVSRLQETGARTDHVEQVRAEVGTIRFRPEEVAAASLLQPLPADFAPTVKLSRELLTRLPGPDSHRSI